MTANMDIEPTTTTTSNSKHQQNYKQQQHCESKHLPLIPTISSSTCMDLAKFMGNKKESFCIRWKGFQGNLVHCLDSLKSDEDFSDVTLTCDCSSDLHSTSVRAHRVVLAACSPYFRRLLRDTLCCQHAVIILNDVKPDILNALMTYMYRGEVFIPEERVQAFFETAKSLELKGLTEDEDDSIKCEPVLDYDQVMSAHPVGDLSLLAAAAATATNQEKVTSGSISKRRKTMPRRLDLSALHQSEDQKAKANDTLSHRKLNDENSPMNIDSSFAINLSTRPVSPGPSEMTPGLVVSRPSNAPQSFLVSTPSVKSPFVARADLLTIPNPSSCFNRNVPTSTLTSEALDMSVSTPPPPTTTPTPPVTTSSYNSDSSPDQMSSMLGPAWKSRQPRLCTYCQRMFSNKFNLKQHILNMHTVGRELHCEICQKKVKNKWYLRRHHVTHHGAPLKK